MPSYILTIIGGVILLIAGIIIGSRTIRHKSFQSWVILLLCTVTVAIGIVLMVTGLGRL